MSIEAMKKVLAYTDNDDRIPSEINHILAQAIAEAEKPSRHELQAKGEHPAPCARHCEANAFKIEIRRLKAQRQHKPCPYVVSTREGTHHCSLSHREPLTFEQVEDCFPEGGVTNKHGEIVVSAQWLHDFAVAVQRAAHGIKENT